MYLRLLSPKQREAYLSLAQMLLHIDGALHEDEAALLELSRLESGLPKLPPPCKAEELATVAKSFDSLPEKMLVLLEACGAVAADGQVTVTERGEIARLAGALSLPFVQVERCFDYVERARKLQQEGLALIAGR